MHELLISKDQPDNQLTQTSRQKNLLRKVNFDIDGVLAKAPVPGKTVFALVIRRFHPKLGKTYKPYHPGKSEIISRVFEPVTSRFITPYESRRLRPDVVPGLRGFQAIGKRQGVDLTMGILSGRELPAHSTTRLWIITNPRLSHFFQPENVSLNTGNSSSLSKELGTIADAERFYSVLQVDDDPKAAVQTALINGMTLVDANGEQKVAKTASILINNLSTKPGLLRWAGVELPENVIPVDSLFLAALAYERMIADGIM